MRMRIVFLDIDGVLNSRAYFTRVGLIPHPWLDTEAIARLDRLCAETDARIVLSSAWRGDSRTPRWLYDRGLTAYIVGQTPWCGATGNRGGEIAEWMRTEAQHPIESFVILDDGDDMDHLLPYLVQTSHDTGLLDEHVDRAIAMLRGASNAQRVLPRSR